MYLINNKRINIDAPYTDAEGVTYTNLRDPELRNRLGVIERPDPVYPDPELFYWTENEDGSLTVTPKPEEQIAQARQAKINAESLAYLASTDWYIVRIAETAKPVPEAILVKRQAARDAIK